MNQMKFHRFLFANDPMFAWVMEVKLSKMESLFTNRDELSHVRGEFDFHAMIVFVDMAMNIAYPMD